MHFLILNFFDLLRLATKTLFANKLRAILTMLGISIGIGAVITLMSVGAGLQKYINDQFAGAGTTTIAVMPGRIRTGMNGGAFAGNTTLTMSDYRVVAASLNNASEVGASFARNGNFIYAGRNSEVNVNGVTPNYSAIRGWKTATGRFVDEQDNAGRSRVVVLGQTVVNDLFPDEDPLDKEVKLNNVPFRVIGVMESKGASFIGDQDAVAFIPILTAQERLFSANSTNATGERVVSQIVAQAASDAVRPQVMADLAQILAEHRHIPPGEENDFSVISSAELINTFGAVTSVLTVFLAAIAAISLLVGGIGIMNIMLVSVIERTREIGLRKAIGATPRAILTQFLAEAVVISVLGGLMGTALGILGALGLAAFAPFPPLIQPAAILLATGFSAAVGLFFGIYPARRAAHLNPIDALRFE